MSDTGKLLMIAGATIFALGILFYFGARLPWFGNLPGDVVVKRDNFTLYTPIGKMIVLSIVLTVVLNLISRFFR